MPCNDTTRRRAGIAAVALLTATISACAGGSSPSREPSAGAPDAPPAGGSVKRDASGAVNACALLTPSQIEAAIGTPVLATTPYGEIECRWTVEPLPALPGSIDPWLDVQFWPADTQMRDVEAAPATGGVVAIDGLGDRAFRTNETRHLWVKHGTDVFVVRSRLGALGDESEASQAAAEAIEVLLARLMLDQL